MSSVNDTLGAAGAGELVEGHSRTWSLSHVTPGIRAAFGAWCKLRARLELAGQREVIGEEAYREDLAVHQEHAAAGAYNWGTPLNPKALGPGVRAQLMGEAGKFQLIKLLLRERHGDVADDVLAAAVNEDPDAWTDAVSNCISPGSVPNEKTPSPAPGAGAGEPATKENPNPV